MNLETVRPIPKHYTEMIRDIFTTRSLKNNNYSLRAFARDLNLAPAHLSEILSKKSNLSLKKAEETAEKLNLSGENQKLFLKLVEISTAHESHKTFLELQLYNFDSNNLIISNNLYSLISEWHLLALLELISLRDFKFDLNWISKKLSISVEEVDIALKVLLKSELIALENGKLTKRYDYFVLPNGNNSTSAKEFHKNVLKKASMALDEQKSEDRNFTAAFLHVKKDDISLMSEKIKKFRRELAKEFESDHNSDSVYMFSVQLFRIDRSDQILPTDE